MKPISNAPKDPIARQEVQEASNPEFTEASSRENIQSGEPLSTLFGKIKKFFTDLKTVAFSGSYTDLSDKPTIPTDFVSKANGGTFNNNIAVSGNLTLAYPGTTSAEGFSELRLGNNIPGGTDGNSHGVILMYGRTDKRIAISADRPTADRSVTLPDKDGLIALTDDIPTVNNATLTIQKNGTTVKTFTANASSDVTCNITMTASDVGLGNVGNFKAVSTVASQGLSSTEKSNARANIGAGTSSLTIGTSSSTAAAGNHNHDSTYLKLSGGSITGNLNIGSSGAGGYLNGSATNGGCNSIMIGDDVWLGDVNSGGILGMKSTGVNCGFKFLNNSGTSIGVLQSTAGTLQFNGYDILHKNNSATVVTSGSYNDLSNKPTIPTVNNATLTIQKNGTTVKTFTANASSNVTCNITMAKSDVGLGNCDNTADSNKSVKYATSAGYVSGEDFAKYNNARRFKQTSSSGNYSYNDGGFGVKNSADSGFTNVYAANVGSSLKFKENVKTMSDEEAEKLLGVRVVTYDYKRGIGIADGADAYNQRGVIAEEVNKIIPYAVIKREFGSDGSVLEPYGIDYSKFVPYLIKMIQIQDERITELENQLKF